MRPPYRNGKVHVKRAMCPTCIFRSGNPMHLEAGRVEGMVATATTNNSAVICHDTLQGDRAVCRGFYDRHPTGTLQIAERLGCIQFDA